MDALVEANAGAARSYGADTWTLQAERLLSDVFEHDLKAFFVTSGTAANSLALSALAHPWNGVLCHPHAHILEDECNAPEFFTGGARLVPITEPHGKLTGKITVAALQTTLERLPADAPHNVVPSVVSLSQASECGLVYRPDELAALGEVARSRSLATHGRRALRECGGEPGLLGVRTHLESGRRRSLSGRLENGALAAGRDLF